MLKIIFPLISLIFMSGYKFTQYHMTIVMTTLSILSLSLAATPLRFFNEFMFSDQFSAPLIILSLWISMLMIIASTKAINQMKQPYPFLITVNSLCIILLLAFWSSSLLEFYLFFEASLIPTTILILTWGYQPERLQASFYFMLYTVFASLPLLLSLLMISEKNNHLSMILPLNYNPLILNSSIWWIITIMAFMAKMPIYGVHLWLPKAHVEAPVAGSMILAGILLKLGGYGLIRMTFLFQSVNATLTSILIPLTLMGSVISGLICIRQSDLKSLIAYSSVSHMGLMTASIMTNSTWAWQGALMMMIAHGLTSSGLFAAGNMTYESTHTRSMFLTKGLLNLFPSMTIMWFLLTAASMATPPSVNLMSEIMLMTSIVHYSYNSILAIIIITFMTGAYSLHLYTASQHGTPPSFLNPMTMPLPRNLMILMLHIVPVFILIMSPEIISSWL